MMASHRLGLLANGEAEWTLRFPTDRVSAAGFAYALDRRPRALLAWSSGKDSAWTLHVLRQARNVEVAALLTTFYREFDRVAMHAVRRESVEAQAVDLPLVGVPLPWPCSNDEYGAAMSATLVMVRARYAISHIVFGDLFLEDVRRSRESRLRDMGLTPLFPLSGLPSPELARDMARAGLKARITCVDPSRLDPSFIGRNFDEDFLDDLPSGVDPCGEHGDSIASLGKDPMFSRPIPIQVGEIVPRDGFVFADLFLP